MATEPKTIPPAVFKNGREVKITIETESNMNTEQNKKLNKVPELTISCNNVEIKAKSYVDCFRVALDQRYLRENHGCQLYIRAIAF